MRDTRLIMTAGEQLFKNDHTVPDMLEHSLFRVKISPVLMRREFAQKVADVTVKFGGSDPDNREKYREVFKSRGQLSGWKKCS